MPAQMLTRLEEPVVNLLLNGKSNKEIAAILDIEESAVKSRLRNVYVKFGISAANKRTALVATLLQHRRIPA